MSKITIWRGEWADFPIPLEFMDVRIRKDGWPDQRFKRGREMVAYFDAKDRPDVKHTHK